MLIEFGRNWHSGSGEEFFSLMYLVVNASFAILLSSAPSLEKRVALHLNKLESPSPKNVLCQVWLKLTRWFLRRLLYETFTDKRKDDCSGEFLQ